MRLLFVMPQIPWPPTQGTALRNYRLMAAAAAGHTIDLLTFGDATLGVPVELARLCGRIEIVRAPERSRTVRLRDLLMGWADMERRLWSPEFAARLDDLLRDGRYDAVQLEGFEVAGYLLGPQALRREANDFERRLPKLIFDDHNAEYELQASAARIDATRPARWPRALYSWIQALRLRRREALYACAADLCISVSIEDATALEAIAPGVKPLVVANGVEVASMPPSAPSAEPTVLFSGKLDYRPNVDACEWLVKEILPRVRVLVPSVQVILAGRDPAPEVLRLAGSGVEVTGSLSSDEMDARRAAAWVYAVPMRMGSGVRFKVLEAMAAGVPLVSTMLGASGTGLENGRHALIADDAVGFASAVASLLLDSSRRERLTHEARALALAAHDWSHITPTLMKAYGRSADAPGAGMSVIATVLNERESVGRLVQSLAGQSLQPTEAVIVDGGSTDGTLETLRAAAGSIVVVDAPGANISVGRNLAIRTAVHDVIAATDAGVALHPAWLERLTAPLRQTTEVQATSGFFVAAPESAWERALGATTLPDVSEIDPARFLPSSRSIAFRRDAFEKAGGYPEWLDYCEDLLFDFALIASGSRPRFVPRAAVRFRPRRSPAAFFTQYYRYARGDGKAGLWGRRHPIRYATYIVGALLAWRAARGDIVAFVLLISGGLAYLMTPFIRLSQQVESVGDYARAAPLVPLVRLTGDVAKMLGYPVGVLWRIRNRRQQ